MNSRRTTESYGVPTTPGTLAEFGRAHPRVVELFWASLRRDVEREHRITRAIDALHGPPRKPRGYRPATQWDETWRRRAEAYRVSEEIGWRESDLEAQRERLREVPTEDYVARLSGQELVRGRMLCPLHEERTPSFYERRGNRWQCFGCGESGDIYTLAAALWDLPLSGPGFLDLHKRLAELFG